MLVSLLAVSKQVLILFILMGIGFICTKKKIFSEECMKGISEFVLHFVTPCVIIKSFHREYDPSLIDHLGISALTALLIYIGSILLTYLILHEANPDKDKVMRYGAIFSNCGYMALPLQQALCGDDGVFFGAAYIAVYNLVSWTYGYMMMSGERKITFKKLILNPGVIGISIGMIFFLTPLKLPEPIFQCVTHLANLNTPMPMIIIGFYLAGITDFSFLKSIKFVIVIFLRMIFYPMITLGILLLCKMPAEVLVPMVMATSAPCAANTTVFSLKFNRDTKLATALVSITTLLSIITMPLIVSLAMLWSGFSF